MGGLPDWDDQAHSPSFELWASIPSCSFVSPTPAPQPALFFLHSRAEPMGTSRATSRLTVMLNSCLVHVVPCDWGHKKRSWKQVRREKVGEWDKKPGKALSQSICSNGAMGPGQCPENSGYSGHKAAMSEKTPVPEAQTY